MIFSAFSVNVGKMWDGFGMQSNISNKKIRYLTIVTVKTED
jgi:hypothetical protein